VPNCPQLGAPARFSPQRQVVPARRDPAPYPDSESHGRPNGYLSCPAPGHRSPHAGSGPKPGTITCDGRSVPQVKPLSSSSPRGAGYSVLGSRQAAPARARRHLAGATFDRLLIKGCASGGSVTARGRERSGTLHASRPGDGPRIGLLPRNVARICEWTGNTLSRGPNQHANQQMLGAGAEGLLVFSAECRASWRGRWPRSLSGVSGSTERRPSWVSLDDLAAGLTDDLQSLSY
jgi:hypothetical protein